MDSGLVHTRQIAKSLGTCPANKTKLRQFSWPGTLRAMKKPARTASESLYPDQAERLYWHRSITGMNQDEYAEKIGMKRARYSNWEAGTTRLSLDGALMLRKRWGLSLDFMFEGIDDALPMTLRSAWRDRPDVKNTKKSSVNPEE